MLDFSNEQCSWQDHNLAFVFQSVFTFEEKRKNEKERKKKGRKFEIKFIFAFQIFKEANLSNIIS